MVVHVVTTGGPLHLENIMWRNFYTAEAPISRKKSDRCVCTLFEDEELKQPFFGRHSANIVIPFANILCFL